MSEKDEKELWSDALAPEPQYEKDFRVCNNKFAFSPGQLNKLFNPKSIDAFYALGGLKGLEYGLQTDLSTGLSNEEALLPRSITLDEARQVAFATKGAPSHSHISHTNSHTPLNPQKRTNTTPFADRIRIFGTNALPDAPKKTFARLLWDAYNDKIIILLTIAAVVSLSLGIYEAAAGQSQVDWIEGVAVCVAIVIVVSVTAGNDWQKQRQFAKLNKRKLDREVRVTRSGHTVRIHISTLLVGDIVHLEPGDSAPADGVIITNHEIKCDESTATGESDQVEKVSGYAAWNNLLEGKGGEADPFIISGSKVLEGLGTYLVTSVGPHSTYGRIMVSLGTETDPTPLQVKLARLASWIGWFGLGSALLLFFVLFIRFLVQLSGSNDTPAEKGQHFMDILIVAVTVIVVAIPEGLPLAVTLALAFATGRMLKENNLVRLLRACETMGNATVICSDKTGTLTQNKMSVVVGFFSSLESFGRLPSDTSAESSSVSISEMMGRFSSEFRELLLHTLALNTTAFEEEREGKKNFVGNKTEIALLQLAAQHLNMNLSDIQDSNHIEHVYPFDSSRKAMAVVYRTESGYRFLVKGAPELLLTASARITLPGPSDEKGIATAPISEDERNRILNRIDLFARASLRTIGMAYRDFPSWPPSSKTAHPGFAEIFENMTWIGAFGIHDPLRPEVSEAIQKCHSAGVQVKMVTGDNISTALSIAESCGIKTPDGLAMEGPELRRLSEEELAHVIPRLQVLARSSPNDKELLVKQLKRLGEIVAVTGDGTNDGPALKAADVGFSMGLSGTEVAREASSIILLDDNFRSIVTAIAWGRAVNDAVAKFLQFQITVNITAVLLTVITAIYNSNNESVFKAVQLLWLNLIMDTFAALALATDPPTHDILSRPPTPRHAPLFTPTMWKMILGQSVYKLTICFVLYFAGHRILSLDPDSEHETLVRDTIIFNTFVWMQIFNELNCRRLDNKFNVLEGIHRNRWFVVINVLMVAGQILIIFVGGAAFGVTRLEAWQWGVCLGFAVVCIPWAAVLKVMPDRWLEVFIGWCGRGMRILIVPFLKGMKKFKGCFRRKKATRSGKGRVPDEESCV
ncbi:Putative Calcium ion P-type ATPase (Eurofung) [Aspergillus calidoustus]|uniref:Calcium-transporting ATPase n=1 Tax=Aspergillus calidoustus TaxID=454130 RepID=A0A0U5GM88_ASPCI|nr:Putative Calcium ion P-type ATPase (Eurofung) [Aspergillus calidoustus]